MNTRTILMLVVSCSVCFADVSFILTTKDNSPVYRNFTRALFEEPLFNAGRNETFQVMAEKGEKYKVVGENGRSGWIEKNLCIKSPAGTRFEFKSADVKAYNENLGFVDIFSWQNTDEIPVRLERSFKDELKENVDKEEIKRVTDNQ